MPCRLKSARERRSGSTLVDTDGNLVGEAVDVGEPRNMFTPQAAVAMAADIGEGMLTYSVGLQSWGQRLAIGCARRDPLFADGFE